MCGGEMAGFGFNISVNYNTVMYGVFLEKLPRLHHDFFFLVNSLYCGKKNIEDEICSDPSPSQHPK